MEPVKVNKERLTTDSMKEAVLGPLDRGKGQADARFHRLELHVAALLKKLGKKGGPDA